MTEEQKQTAYSTSHAPSASGDFTAHPVSGITGLFRETNPTVHTPSQLGFDIYAENLWLREKLEKEKERRKDAEEKYEDLMKSGVKDGTTGLPNKDSFNEYSKTQFRNFLRHMEENIHYAQIDLDNFKPLNDTYGHDAGDVMLRMFADKLRKHFRIGSDDFCGRTGGDEFSIIFTHSLTPDVIQAKLQELQKEAETWSIRTRNNEGQYVDINFGGFSFGLASTTNQNFESETEIKNEADRLMYINKTREGKITVPRQDATPRPSPAS